MIFLTSGQAIGSGMGPQMVTPENSNIEVFYLMFTQFLICLSSLILYLLFFQNQPADFIPREETHQLTIKEELRVLFKSSNFVYLFSSAVIGGGVGNYLSVILELVAHDHGFSSQESSYFGMISILSGVVSCFVCSLITSATHKFKLVCVVTSGGTILGLMFIALAFKIHSFTLAALASAFNGIFLSPVYSVPLEFACEVTFPLRENVSSSLIACLGTVFAVIPITVAYLFENDSYKCLEIGIGLQVISFIFILITREDLKRRNAELMKNVDDSRLVIND
jgi:FLVCR family feline leukemia virus subgroup C receptor-related protein